MENAKLPLTRNPIFILVLGIVSLVIIQLLGPVAWFLGNETLKGMPVGTPQRGLVVAGRIMGLVATVLFALSVLWFLFKVVMPGI